MEMLRMLDNPEHVEQGQRDEHHVLGLEVEQSTGHVRVHVQGEVRELRALRRSGGPGGVDDYRRVGGTAQRQLRPRLVAGEQRLERGAYSGACISGQADDV